MRKFIKKYPLIALETLLISINILILILFAFLKFSTSFCEWYSRTIGRFFQTVNGFLVKYIPFSITEVYIILLIAGSITLLIFGIKSIKKDKKYHGIGLMLLIPLLIVSTVKNYNASCTFQYNRAPLPLGQFTNEVSEGDYETIISHFLDDFNYCASLQTFNSKNEVKSPYSLQKLNKIFEKEYRRLTNDYFSPFTSYGKPMMSSFIYRELWITGLYYSPFGESNINVLQTNAEMPFTIAHELAHSKGIMRENDANAVAIYLTLTSSDTYIRYCGYINSFTHILRLANYSSDTTLYDRLVENIDSRIMFNWGYISNYWESHKLGKIIGDFFNDLYLKLQGTSEGTDSYDDTPPEVDPHTGTIVSYSNFQKIFLDIYFNHQS